ncbi:endolytic transglycosylase MltG [Georgenia faecalis]|uniref:Endolytic murein transglycosylase n=1 Tax=Georgenia faecalis TaxID=2483799 RepID=A0ABV9DBB7_9MICO|nr:endolytic transglycosylase MltG [Georgenia faecalis]
MSELFDQKLAEPSPSHSEQQRRAERRERAQRRRQRRKRTAIAVVLSLLLIAGLAVAAFFVLRPLLTDRPAPEATDFPGPGSGSVEVVIEPGTSGTEMGEMLTEAGVVASPGAFSTAFTANPAASGIQPGTYVLLEEMAAADAVAALLDPANKSEVTITVPEGWRATQVYERIAAVTQLPLADVEAAAADPAAIGLPAEAGGNPEGWFAAATYSFQPSVDATTILRTMVEQTVSTLDALAVPAAERQAVLTKASIVEHEVFLAEDYGRVARVIENRLADTEQVNGRLQMDSTVLYGVGKSGGIPTRSDLDDDNPYNTYLHPGLPPTPIGAPGAAAVEAVIAPPPGDWLYFVTVDLDSGETLFTGDYAEHQANRAALNRWLEEHPSSDEG